MCILYFFFFFIILFIYISKVTLFLVPHPWVFHPNLSHIWEGTPPPIHPPSPHPTSILLPWGIKFPQDKAHPLPLRTYKAVLCCTCAQSHRPAHVLSLIFGLIWEFRGFLVSCHCCSSYGFAILLSSFSPCSKYSIRFPELSPIVSYKYLHLSQAAALRTSQRTAMPGSCLQAQYGISNSVRVWC